MYKDNPQDMIRLVNLLNWIMDCSYMQEVQKIKIDVKKTEENLAYFESLKNEKIEQLKKAMPKIPVKVKRKKPNSLYKKDGSTYWTEFTFVLVRDAQGKPNSIIGVGRDISERKQAEQSLRESEEKYRSLFENVPDGVCQITPDGTVLAVNPALVKMLGSLRKTKTVSKAPMPELMATMP